MFPSLANLADDIGEIRCRHPGRPFDHAVGGRVAERGGPDRGDRSARASSLVQRLRRRNLTPKMVVRFHQELPMNTAICGRMKERDDDEPRTLMAQPAPLERA